MNIELVKDTGAARLAVVFLGYAFRPACLAHLELGDFDLAVAYDYRDFKFDAGFLRGREVWLAAWSMGVWAANRVLGGLAELNLARAVAINGTPFGIDKTLGIAPASFAASIENFDFEGFKKLCFLGDLKRVKFEFAPNPLSELKSLYAAASEPCQNALKWDKAIISRKDLVFPPAACEWFACPKEYLAAPHFPFFKFESLERIFEI